MSSPRHFQRHLAQHMDRRVGKLMRWLPRIPKHPIAIWRARVEIKKIRSCLKLLRRWLPPQAQVRLRSGLRRIAKSLAHAREAQSLLSSWDDLADGHPQPRIRTRLILHLDQERARIIRKSAALAAMVRELFAHVDWTVELSLDDAQQRLDRTYAKARRAYRAAKRLTLQARLHDWRKRVKDLCHQYDMLHHHVALPPRRLEERWARLASVLGEVHDLHMLILYLRRLPGPSLAMGSVIADATRREHKLSHAILDKGAKLFSAAAARRFAHSHR